MGLIRTTIKGTLADQKKAYFYCEAIDNEVLALKGKRRQRSSGNKWEDSNVIASGSRIAVADGQCMMIVQDGRIMEFCAEPGEYIYDSSADASILKGDLDNALDKLIEEMWNRFEFGGEPGKDQRIYYFNTKEITGNLYGTASPIPFRIVDHNIGLDIDISIKCHGEYSYRIVNPMLFYTNVCGNVTDVYLRAQLGSIMKAELLTALQPAFAKISSRGIRYSELPAHAAELARILNEELSEKWIKTRGIQIITVGMNGISLSEEDEKLLKEIQRTIALRGAQRLETANTISSETIAPENAIWICDKCQTHNTGKFCTECGNAKPECAPDYRCSKCGWEPKDLNYLPKFCPECGQKFNM